MIDIPTFEDCGCSEVTEAKQHIYAEIVKKHLIVVDFIYSKYKMNRHKRTYTLIDATAGSGAYDMKTKNGDQVTVRGSPLRFLDILHSIKTDFSGVSMYLIDESKKGQIPKLREHIKAYPNIQRNISIKYIEGLYEEYVPSIVQSNPMSYGLAYFDPNGVVDFECMEEITNHPNFKKIDLLFNFNATALKRCRKNPRIKSKEDFIDKFSKLQKQFWYIREPYGSWQWSFLFGCNTDNFRLPRSLDFNPIESKRGQEILDILNYTKEELDTIRFNKIGQKRLF